MGEPTERSIRAYRIPLAPRIWALVEGEFPMTEAEWSQFWAVLDAMKPGLVAEPARTDAGEDKDG